MQWYIIIEAGEQVYAALCREAHEGGKPAPPMWRGFTYELCAGLVDKAKSLPEIAAEEARPTRAVTPPLVLCSSRPSQLYRRGVWLSGRGPVCMLSWRGPAGLLAVGWGFWLSNIPAAGLLSWA